MSLTAPAGGISAKAFTARPRAVLSLEAPKRRNVGARRYDEFTAALAGVFRSREAHQQALTFPGQPGDEKETHDNRNPHPELLALRERLRLLGAGGVEGPGVHA
jgi:hypothetical protein